MGCGHVDDRRKCWLGLEDGHRLIVCQRPLLVAPLGARHGRPGGPCGSQTVAHSWQRRHISSQQQNRLTLNVNLPGFQEMGAQLVWGV
jgi:hypothetical protein